MPEQRLYSIGEMAKITNVSVQTLRYYDQIGLLKPVRVDATTNYRYYDEAQIYIMDLIKSLKYIGTPLEDIKKAQAFTPEEMFLYLTEQEKVMEHKIRRMVEVQHTLLKTKKQLENHLLIPIYNEVYESVEEQQRLLTVRANDLTADYVPNEYFSALTKTVEREGVAMNSRYGGIYPLRPYEQLQHVVYSHVFTPLLTDRYIEVLDDEMDVLRMQEGRYACIAFKYDLNTYLAQYEKLYQYIQEHGLIPTSDVYEFFVQANYSPNETPVYVMELKVKIS